jgi:hypothetical protein
MATNFDKYWHHIFAAIDDARRYYSDVASVLGGTLVDYHEDAESRVIEISVGEPQNIIIRQSWRHDGTSTKPVTTLTFGYPDTEEHNLGRFAIWGDPIKYGEDIAAVIERLSAE